MEISVIMIKQKTPKKKKKTTDKLTHQAMITMAIVITQNPMAIVITE